MILPSLLLLLAAAPADAAPHDFVDDALLLQRVVACTGDAPLPPNLDQKVVDTYCKVERERIDTYQKKWGQQAREFLTHLQPPGLPSKVVYPFGGGDLLGGLTTYPNATELTTLSLELAGDPRRLRSLNDSKRLASSLALLQEASRSTLIANDNLSSNLSKIQKGEIPGQLALHLLGLAIHDMVPVSVRYFRIEPNGSLHYLTDADIAAYEQNRAHRLHDAWASPDFSVAFSNVEIAFVPKGSPQGTPPRIHRHIAADLSDAGLAKHPELLKYLEAQGKVSAMTKAASYLLWRNDFATIRNYLLHHMEFMISDSTGIPPEYVAKAGFVQETYGAFEKSFLEAPRAPNQEFVKLFASQPSRPLPMRYGYPDGSPAGHNHLILTRHAPQAPAAPAAPHP